ncbi:hypothetical protein DICPUDRAFT_150148 [Dictyostelium purpureum]|uniref:Uncharacterized protein n=1 Tax=Dictyostelium purpureum TaxID=5786 RepID=F0ZFK4_DICPU|nr:uncharacterized protein DICPUDRAFT_150148 [Dictyostelium purpureum]EGC37313.1 hypothetical protein DICPUDRAFT_150148 [Dictyostelium purpureum]|eukprot:XP_003286201.1 hypothetical protein DICPUDRAFT_150148 [Dictyostelium purpureum]
MDGNDKDKTIQELLLKIQGLEKEVISLKSKLSTRQKLNEQKKKISIKRDHENFDSSTDEEFGNDHNEFDDIKMEELQFKPTEEIIKVAKSMGLQCNHNEDNSEILKKIRDTIKTKKTQHDKMMGKIAKRKSLLAIPVSESEKLFWKVIRNTFLFKKITGHIHSGSYTLKYEQIFDASLLVHSREAELLKYKVKRSDYLTNIKINDIFEFIRDDTEFYSNLFKNYSKIVFSPQGRFNIAVSKCCRAAIEVLIEEYDCKPTIEDIKKSIKIQSFKTFQCLVGFYKKNNLPLPLTDTDIWKCVFSSVDAAKDDIEDSKKEKEPVVAANRRPMRRIQPRHKKIKEKKKKETKISKISKFINYLIQDIELPAPKITKQKIKKLFQCPLYDHYTLEDLINSCRSILNLDFQTTKIVPTVTTPFSKLKELNDAFSLLTKDQSKQTVMEYFLENYQTPNQNTQLYGNIIKLLTMHYSMFSKPSLLYLVITGKANIESIKKCMQSKSSYYLECMYLDAFRLGELSLILAHPQCKDPTYFKTVFSDHIFPDFLNPQSFLFQFKVEKVKKIQFLRSLGESISENKCAINMELFFKILVANDDLEILEYGYSQLKKPIIDLQKTPNEKLDILYFIKSPEILEYILQHFFKDIHKPIKANSFILNDRLDLLERYIELLPSAVKKLDFNTNNISNPSFPEELFNVFKRVIENPILSRYITIDREKFTYFNINYIPLNQIIDLLEHYPNVSFTFNLTKNKVSYFYCLISRYILQKKDPNLKKRMDIRIVDSNGSSDFDYDENEDIIYYCSDSGNSYNLLEYPFDHKNISLYNNSSSPTGGYMEFINNFMKVHFTPKPTAESPTPSATPPRFRRYEEVEDHGLMTILKCQARSGNLPFFRSIVDNGFSFIFKKDKASKKDKVKKFYYSTLKLRELFLGALINDHLDLCLFFLDELSFSLPDNQFNGKITKNSACHYNLFNRFNFNFNK